jgi:hypothetical protein
MPIDKKSVSGLYRSVQEETQGSEGAIGWPEVSASMGLPDQGKGGWRQCKVQGHSAYNQAGGLETNLVGNQPCNQQTLPGSHTLGAENRAWGSDRHHGDRGDEQGHTESDREEI